MPVTLPRFSARSVASAIRSGSSLPVLVDTPGGLFVTKLRGAAQGPAALIAEVVVAEIAEVLGLPVPERVVVDIATDTPSSDKNDELADLLARSVGENLGFRFLNGAVELRSAERDRLGDDFATRLLWLDSLVQNPDRTARNPNVLMWKGQPWLIDHGAALPFQHDWGAVSEDSPREAGAPREHLFADKQRALGAYDEALAAGLGRDVLEAALLKVPDSLLAAAQPGEDLFRLRARYAAFLWKRLRAPRPFVT